MSRKLLRIGIVGCGHAARMHLERLVGLDDVHVVGCADGDLTAAEAQAALVPPRSDSPQTLAFTDHRELLKQLNPDALAIFTPHFAHYRPAVDGLQAGCHLFIEKPLSTNVQEAVDIVGLARARGRKVAVGHQYRLRPSLVEARRRLSEGAIGPVHLVTATLAQSWLTLHTGSENAWRFDPKVAGGGILTDSGDHLVDALLWTTRQAAVEVASLQSRLDSGLDIVTAATIRLVDGTLATLAVSGISASPVFELNFYGEAGRMRVTELNLEQHIGEETTSAAALPELTRSIDGDFVKALVDDDALCCPADEALDTVRLLEAIARSAATAQVVRLA
jgi:predicted dehydrogenase